jgi:single-strand selective monofunctional uracil DNA glycosylase
MYATGVSLVEISERLSRRVGRMQFAAPVTHVYNPLDYAWAPHVAYLERYGKGCKRFVLLGMNPGPFGMAQTGVPFGEVNLVRDWMKIDEPVRRPKHEHPKRPIEGFACQRSEVSGARLWGFAKDRFQKPERFFRQIFVVNYCPLVFMETSGRNCTPDKLKASDRAPLFDACDEALAEVVSELKPEVVIGVGAFAEKRARQVLGNDGPRIGCILHPSPASPKANRGWADAAAKELAALGVELPEST